MRLGVLTVGRPRDAAVRSLCDDYLRRCAPVFRADWVAVAAGDPRGSGVPARAVAAEGAKLLRRLEGGALTVALDERGKRRTSLELARWLGTLRDEGRSLQLVVGGAHGLAREVLARCPQRLSLSPLTLPHELALLLLCEQLYRARTILRNEPYHHG